MRRQELQTEEGRYLTLIKTDVLQPGDQWLNLDGIWQPIARSGTPVGALFQFYRRPATFPNKSLADAGEGASQ